MNEAQVKEVFREIIHIGNKFVFSLTPLRIIRPLTTSELKELLTSWEYKHFKKHCPALSEGIESFFTSINNQGERKP